MIKMKMHEALSLADEIESMSKETIAFTTKFKINKIKSSLKGVMENFNDVRNEAIEKFGETVPGIDGEEPKMGVIPGSEGYKEFIKQMDSILTNEDVEIPEASLSLSDFEGIKTDKPYTEIMKLIVE